jgi:ABC-type multidrug transport system fused ATPase/permease subunit
MGSILEIIGVFVIMSLVVWMVMGVIHMILHAIGLWDKMVINIKLPKRKRFLNKVDPIYELNESDFGGLVVRKWELGYDDTFGLQMLMIYIPYPIKLLRYKYIQSSYIWLDEKTKLSEITEDLGDMFERIWAIENAKEIEEKRIKKEHQDNIDRINKVFKENFEE